MKNEAFRHIATFYKNKMFSATTYTQKEYYRINYELYFFKSGGFN